jgi:hypothetical protein
MYDGIGNEMNLYAGLLQPETIVGVLLNQHRFIEPSDRLMHSFPDTQGARTGVNEVGRVPRGGQSILLWMLLKDFLHPSGIELNEIDTTRYELVLTQRLTHRAQPPGRDLIIGITEYQRFASSCPRTDISRMRLAAPVAGINDA